MNTPMIIASSSNPYMVDNISGGTNTSSVVFYTMLLFVLIVLFIVTILIYKEQLGKN